MLNTTTHIKIIGQYYYILHELWKLMKGERNVKKATMFSFPFYFGETQEHELGEVGREWAEVEVKDSLVGLRIYFSSRYAAGRD